MYVGKISPAGAFPQERLDSADSKPDAAAGNATVLVPVAAPAPRRTWTAPAGRPAPAFVAHLIATADQFPETRTLRRASETDAQAAYGTTLRRSADRPSASHRLIRTI